MPAISPQSPLDVPVTVVGHPLSSVGKGEEMRAGLRALNRVAVAARALDVFRHLAPVDPAHLALMQEHETRTLPAAGIRIFHINADEVEAALAALAARGLDFEGGYNIIVPAWELPRFPEVWRPLIARFDEVWAISGFVAEALAAAGLSAHRIGQSAEIEPAPFLPRRHFGLRESAFLLLSFFALSDQVKRAVRIIPSSFTNPFTSVVSAGAAA